VNLPRQDSEQFVYRKAGHAGSREEENEGDGEDLLFSGHQPPVRLLPPCKESYTKPESSSEKRTEGKDIRISKGVMISEYPFACSRI